MSAKAFSDGDMLVALDVQGELLDAYPGERRAFGFQSPPEDLA